MKPVKQQWLPDANGCVSVTVLHPTASAKSMQAEEALQFLGAIVYPIDDAVIRKTPEGTILSWNGSAE